jgi:metal-dependent HD superfamily phosphatase/phosphodiesterase
MYQSLKYSTNKAVSDAAGFSSSLIKIDICEFREKGENKRMNEITFKQIRECNEINMYIEKGDTVLAVLGITEHSKAHAMKVATIAGNILKELGYSEHVIELAKITVYMHDIGNCVNRNDHAHNGAILSYQILKGLNMNPEDIATIMAAIGNHDEKTGTAVDAVSAAVILADKTDVRRNRVRNQEKSAFDIHDRVNYAAVTSKLDINMENKTIQLDIKLDDKICSVMDYFEIFLQRMIMCKRAAEVLDLKFRLYANGSKLC